MFRSSRRAFACAALAAVLLPSGFVPSARAAEGPDIAGTYVSSSGPHVALKITGLIPHRRAHFYDVEGTLTYGGHEYTLIRRQGVAGDHDVYEDHAATGRLKSFVAAEGVGLGTGVISAVFHKSTGVVNLTVHVETLPFKTVLHRQPE